MILKHYIIAILLLCYLKGFTQGQDHSSKNHLYVKADILSPVLSLLPSIKTYTFGASLEYKLKSKWGVQLNGYYYWEDNSRVFDREGFFVMPELRYYINEHLIGIYLKSDNYQYAKPYNPVFDEIWFQNTAIGILYGYQKEINRFVIEGRVGFGVSLNTKNFQYYQKDDAMVDTILAVNIGWKIY